MDKAEHKAHLQGGEKKGLHHRIYHHVKRHKFKWLVGLFAAVIIILVFLFFIDIVPKEARVGDIVVVDYIGTLDDGTIFDTSIEGVARNSNVYNLQRVYKPLEFTIGGSEVLLDFGNAVVGMKKGDVKKIKITADKAYPYDEGLVVKGIPVNLVIKNSYAIAVDKFEGVVAGGRAELGKEYILPQLPWKVKVTSLDRANNTMTFASLAKVGDSVPMPMRSWNATITSINDENITVKQDVAIGGIVIAPNGQVGSVVDVSKDTYDVDMNLPIAGKDLNFDVTLVEIKE